MTLFARFSAVAAIALTCAAPAALHAQSPASAAVAPASTPKQLDQHTLDKRTAPVLKKLKLDAAKEATVRPLLEQHFQALQDWHAEVDPQLKSLWTKWAAARTPPQKDEAKAAAVGTEIDQVYGAFRPRHDAFLAQLATALSPAQIETVKNALTTTPGLERTYAAYLQMVPALTEAQKQYIRDRLLVAREEAMDAVSNKEKADLFKKQKVQVEAYIDAQGYDYKKSYAAFVAKLKAEAAEHKADAKP